MLPIDRAENSFSEKEKKLLEQVRGGLVAEELKRLFGEIFEQMEKGVYADFAKINPLTTEKFDTNRYVVLSLKLKVIQDFQVELGILMSNGKIAQNDIGKMNVGR